MARFAAIGRARAMREEKERIGRPDLVIVLLVTALTFIGIVIVYSASFAMGLYEYGDANYFILRQILGTVGGLVCMFTLARIDYRRLSRISPLILLAAIGGLLFVLIPGLGHASNGAARWVQIGPLPPVQPSEFAKLAMVIYIAAWLAAKGDQVKQFSLGVIPFVMMVGLVGGLIMLEPDMGTFLVIVSMTTTMFFVAGATLRHMIVLVLAGFVGGTLLIVAEGYRAERFMSFLHAEKDPSGLGFQILQLLIALGSGGTWGRGLGESRQKFFYIPGAHTDGILAIVGEEAGFVGCLVVLVLFAGLIARGVRTALRCEDDFGYLLAVGVTSWIGYQAVINIAGITRMLPLTGIPLPFLSYGSSALVALLAAVGILLGVSRHARAPEHSPRPRGGGPPGRTRRIRFLGPGSLKDALARATGSLHRPHAHPAPAAPVATRHGHARPVHPTVEPTHEDEGESMPDSAWRSA